MVSPHSMVPLSDGMVFERISRSVVLDMLFWLIIATLSPFSIVKLILSNIFSLLILWLKFSTFNTFVPQGLFSLNWIKGDRRRDIGSSSGRSFSIIFLREVACLDFDALALKRRTKSSSSLILLSLFLVLSCCCFVANSLELFQKS